MRVFVSAEEVAAHLGKYGLATKPPEAVDGGRVLGLRLSRDHNGVLKFHRGKEIPEISEGSVLTRRQLFSICGRLVGHYPVAGWLRVACSFLKRPCEGHAWEDPVGERAQTMTAELMDRVRAEDSVSGVWHVPNTQVGKVWCDASSLALGVALEVQGSIVEDAAWLRKSTDCAHINVAELDAVLKGVNLALKWKLREIEVMTDSATVLSWLRSVITADHGIKTYGAAEMLIKRRLAVFADLIATFDLRVTVTFVRSEVTRADALTRVKKTWLQAEDNEPVCAASVDALHGQHDFGVERTLYLARLVKPTLARADVERCVRNCTKCQSIDPAPVQHHPGVLGVEQHWSRLAVDITHYRGKCYLTIVDCGASRFAIWRDFDSETAANIARILEELFRERRPVTELLMDNGAGFRSHQVAKVCRRWNVRRHFRGAYRPAGNGIVERHHRTIKRMAMRSGASPLQMVFWYNLAPKDGQDKQSVPCNMLHTYIWRHPAIRPEFVNDNARRQVLGDTVWMKPPGARCTSRWQMGRVTGVTSTNNVDVDGVPKHVLDIRRVFREDDSDREESGSGDGRGGEDEEVLPGPDGSSGRHARDRRPPAWLNDYVV